MTLPLRQMGGGGGGGSRVYVPGLADLNDPDNPDLDINGLTNGPVTYTAATQSFKIPLLGSASLASDTVALGCNYLVDMYDGLNRLLSTYTAPWWVEFDLWMRLKVIDIPPRAACWFGWYSSASTLSAADGLIGCGLQANAGGDIAVAAHKIRSGFSSAISPYNANGKVGRVLPCPAVNSTENYDSVGVTLEDGAGTVLETDAYQLLAGATYPPAWQYGVIGAGYETSGQPDRVVEFAVELALTPTSERAAQLGSQF